MASSRANTTRIAMRDDPLCINKSHVMRGPTRYESVSIPKIDRYMQWVHAGVAFRYRSSYCPSRSTTARMNSACKDVIGPRVGLGMHQPPAQGCGARIDARSTEYSVHALATSDVTDCCGNRTRPAGYRESYGVATIGAEVRKSRDCDRLIPVRGIVIRDRLRRETTERSPLFRTVVLRTP